VICGGKLQSLGSGADTGKEECPWSSWCHQAEDKQALLTAAFPRGEGAVVGRPQPALGTPGVKQALKVPCASGNPTYCKEVHGDSVNARSTDFSF
jgi:hypothetical protein